ncbi:MAG: PAS domain S-box protein, partial [Anaerolineales bacterium]|nr:PAS domain S-box protein [Anaerolineales bacterium]
NYRILIVDDDDAQAEMMGEFLRISGFSEIDRAADIHSLWQRLQDNAYEIMLLDYKLPDGTGLDVLDQMGERNHEIPVVMITGQGDERIAAQAIQRGASDYLLKSTDYLLTLPALIRKTVRAHDLKLSVKRSLEQIRYQAMLLDNVRDAIVVWDMSGRITYWNPAAAALFGWSAEERLGRLVSQIYLQTFTPAITLPRQGNGGNQHVLRKCLNRQGQSVWVSSRLSALSDKEQGGRLLGYMDVSHDITRRVEMEQALRESEARYRAIVEDYQTELICRYKPNGALTFANEVFCRYFGKQRSELLGMNFLYFIPENERSRIVQHLLSFSPNKTVGSLEHQVNLPGRGLHWLQRTDRAILDESGHIFEFQSVARDITEQKMMESQIKAAQAHLVQAARMATIGEMASGVAHQIYNPLTTIIADAQILLRKLPPNQPGRDSAEAIEQAGWRLQQAIQRLMEFSRPTSEALTPAPANQAIQSAISLVSAHLEAIGCRLEVNLAEGLPLVRGNQRQLENLWVNLLLLARDASADGRGDTIRVTSQPGPPSAVVFEICDNGQPIPRDQLATIFEPNFVGPTSGRGTGMELSICREIVRQHGGQITADSAPGHDTIIRVTLPAEA